MNMFWKCRHNPPCIRTAMRADDHQWPMFFLAYVIGLSLIFLPEAAYAADSAKTFAGVTDFLKSITNLLIYEWGYYLGIITLAIQGYRWKTGRIDLMQLGGWGLGIALVLFAPNIVGDLKSRSGGHL